MPEKIKANFFFNISSQSKEKLEASIQPLIEALKKEDGIMESIFAYEIPQHQNGTYTIYIEAEFHFKNIQTFYKLCVKMLPASVEIIEPTEINLTLPEMQEIASNLMQYTNLIRRVLVKK